jgi:hypothetical protein
MRLAVISRLAVLAAIALTCGCNSNNKGKIEATRWSSLPATIKGQTLPADSLQLSFGGNGQMVYRIKPLSGTDQTYKGTYSLGFENLVTLHLEQELAGKKTHVETVVINGDRLTMTDLDGTSLTFVKK